MPGAHSVPRGTGTARTVAPCGLAGDNRTPCLVLLKHMLGTCLSPACGPVHRGSHHLLSRAAGAAGQGQGDAKLGDPCLRGTRQGLFSPPGSHAGQGWCTCGWGHRGTPEPAPCSMPWCLSAPCRGVPGAAGLHRVWAPASVDTASPCLVEAAGCGDTRLTTSLLQRTLCRERFVHPWQHASRDLGGMGRGHGLQHIPGWVAGVGQGDLVRDQSGAGPAHTLLFPRPTGKTTWWSGSMSQLGCRSYAVSRRETPRNPAPRVSPCECQCQSSVWVHAWGWSSARASCGQEDGEGSTTSPKGVGRGAEHLVGPWEPGCSAGSHRDVLQVATGFSPCRASSLSCSCGLGDPCGPGAAAGPGAWSGA